MQFRAEPIEQFAAEVARELPRFGYESVDSHAHGGEVRPISGDGKPALRRGRARVPSRGERLPSTGRIAATGKRASGGQCSYELDTSAQGREPGRAAVDKIVRK